LNSKKKKEDYLAAFTSFLKTAVWAADYETPACQLFLANAAQEKKENAITCKI
jgi:hypothetical protein